MAWQAVGKPIVACPRNRSDAAIEYAFQSVLESITELPEAALSPRPILWREDDRDYGMSSRTPNRLTYRSPLDMPDEFDRRTRTIGQRETCAVCLYHSDMLCATPGNPVTEVGPGISWEHDWSHGWPFLRRVLVRVLHNSIALHASGKFKALPAAGAHPLVVLFRNPEVSHRWPLEINFHAGLDA